MEEEFIKNQERLKPQEEKQEVSVECLYVTFDSGDIASGQCTAQICNVWHLEMS